MNSRKLAITLLIFFMMFGCSPATVTPSIQASPTDTIATATTSPIPSSTHTAVPTLPVEDARQRLLELLATNGNCRLPCLWGITPGKSNYPEARNILMLLSGIAETTHFDSSSPVDDISLLYVESESRLYNRVAYLYSDDGIVSRIGFRAIEQQLSKDEYGNQLTAPVFDSPTFSKRVEYYSLSHVLTEQGIPDSVMISFYLPSDNPTFAGGFEIALLYPEQGIWAHYTMPLYSQSGTQRGCPASAHVEMDLYPSGNPEAFYLLLEETDWARMKHGYKPVEEATSMSLEEFYETFRNSTDKCIETPENLWLLYRTNESKNQS